MTVENVIWNDRTAVFNKLIEPMCIEWSQVYIYCIQRWKDERTVRSLNCGDASRHNERWTGCSGPNAFLIKCTANPEPDSTDTWNTKNGVFFKGQPLSFPSSLLRTAMPAMPKWLQQNNRFLAVEKKTKQKQNKQETVKQRHSSAQ